MALKRSQLRWRTDWLEGCRAGGSRAALTAACSGPTPKPAAEAPVAKAAQTVEQLEAAVAENPLKEAYFGETHVHTSYSLDAYIGGARLTPDDAYKFAQGKDVTINGQAHNIKKPLDWAAVSDHAEFIGEMYSTQVKGAKGGDNPMLEELRGLTKVDEQRAWFLKYVVENNRGANPTHPPFYAGPETTKSAWKDVHMKAAVENYRPGKFTTLAGYEWTAAPKAGNMHRNVIFRDLTVPDMPFSALDSPDEEKLWAWMAEQEKKGSKLLAIPHNSNGSKGLMFEPIDNSGQPLTGDYARLRSHFERLIEMMQIKGNSEVHRKFWPADEFADFENADSVGSFSGRTFKKEFFVRWAVTKGLDYQAKLGANPFQFGFIGGTDNHNGAPSDVVEDNYIGSHGPADGTLKDRREGEIDGWIKGEGVEPGVDLRGLGDEEHARGHLGRDGGARELRHVGHAHQGAVLRRQRTRRCADRPAGDGRGGLQRRRADGRDDRGSRQGARPSRCGHPRTLTGPTSTGSRSSRAGSTRRASRRTACSTSSGPATASPARTARCLRLGTRPT